MNGTMRQKALLGIMLVVLVAWTADFLALRPKPKSAVAMVAAELPTNGGESLDQDQLKTLVDALLAMPTDRQPLRWTGRDLFLDRLPPATPMPVQTGPGSMARRGPGQAAEEDAAEPTFELNGVLNGTRRLAIIDGSLYAAGQKLNDFVLEEIGDEHVVLRRGRQVLRLEIERPSLESENN